MTKLEKLAKELLDLNTDERSQVDMLVRFAQQHAARESVGNQEQPKRKRGRPRKAVGRNPLQSQVPEQAQEGCVPEAGISTQ